MIVRQHVPRLCIIALVGLAGCQSRPVASGQALQMPAPVRAPFIGRVTEVRGSVMLVDEESQSNRRRVEILVPSTTEITTRNGMLVPVTGLRRMMRVTVWFRGPVNETSSALHATADRIVVDY